MKFPAIAVIALAACSTLPATPSRSATFDDFKQSAVPKAHAELAKSVGILVAGRSYCSAFCVAPDIIASAGHCLGPTFRKRRSAVGRFTLGGRTSAIRGGTRTHKLYNTITGTTRLAIGPKRNPDDQYYHDWMVARLQKPLCRGRELEIADLSLNDMAGRTDRAFSIFFQSRKRRGLRQRYSPCVVDRKIGPIFWHRETRHVPFPENLLLHNCRIDPGGSGAPLFWITDEGPRVVGIQTGTLSRGEEKRKVAGVAMHARTILSAIDRLRNVTDYPDAETTAEIQDLLRKTGDYSSSVDGVYGIGTRQAILDYTVRNSLPVPTDRPLDSLIDLIREDPTAALPDNARNGFEVYTYHPWRSQRARAFAYRSQGPGFWYRWNSIGFISAAMQVQRDCSGGDAQKCELYAINDHIIHKVDEAGMPKRVWYRKGRADELEVWVRKRLGTYRAQGNRDFRALAFDPGTGRLAQCDHQASPAAARACARRDCEAGGRTCADFALGHKMIFGLSEETVRKYDRYYAEALSLQ